ncbi:hypothetical protein GCM10017708_05140 [Arthrobacter citreus]
MVTQDGFDGDGVDIYTEHGKIHYVRNRDANELGGFPRVKDRNCNSRPLRTPCCSPAEHKPSPWFREWWFREWWFRECGSRKRDQDQPRRETCSGMPAPYAGLQQA